MTGFVTFVPRSVTWSPGRPSGGGAGARDARVGRPCRILAYVGLRFATMRLGTMSRFADTLPVGPRDDALHRGARRTAHRVPLHADVEIDSPRAARGVALNVSRGGVRLALEGEVRVGDVCRLTLRTDPVSASTEHAKVVWKRRLPDGWVAGLAFV